MEGLISECRNVSLAPFCDVTRRKAIERETNKFATDIERHLSELGLTGTMSSEALRQEEFEAIMLASKANFEATILGVKTVADLKDDIARYKYFNFMFIF